MQHDKYDQDILRTLRRIAKALENIETHMRGFKEWTPEEYGEAHPEWVTQLDKINSGYTLTANEIRNGLDKSKKVNPTSTIEHCDYYKDNGHCYGCIFYGDGDQSWSGEGCPYVYYKEEE